MAEIDKKIEVQAASREGLSTKGDSLLSIYIRRFNKHTLGKIGGIVLLVLYTLALLADFVSPYSMTWTDKRKSYHPPSRINWTYTDENGDTSFRPWVHELTLSDQVRKTYGFVPEHTIRAISVEQLTTTPELRAVATSRDPQVRKQEILAAVQRHYNLPATHEALGRIGEQIDALMNSPKKTDLIRIKVIDKEILGKVKPLELKLIKGNVNFLSFFNEGITYSFLGLFDTRIHFFGSETGGYFPVGADRAGRDMLSRLLHGSRISLSVGLIGVSITFVIGLLFGGLAGYFGGVTDMIMMRFSEIMMSFPAIYLLFTLRAIFPPSLTSIQVYLLIVAILAFTGWAGLARIIRGLVLSLRNEDYVLSAKSLGLSHLKIIVKHILPNTLSFVIVQATITIPAYILGESALSLLGLGITEPQSSWGLMLSVARSTRIVKDFPWVLIPGFMIFIAILSWSFFGDGIRDAVDPRSKH
jgi:peptide/nickel transport system permease protein